MYGFCVQILLITNIQTLNRCGLMVYTQMLLHCRNKTTDSVFRNSITHMNIRFLIVFVGKVTDVV